MAFRVGQKVVCVNAAERLPFSVGWNPKCDIPKEGAVYTVRAIGVQYGDPGLKLEEICWCGHNYGRWIDDGFYFAGRFRPIVERNTDITVFTEILDRVNKRERVSIHD